MNKTHLAVVNIVNKRILINLTFRMLVNIHFQKYKPLQYLKTVYIVYNKGMPEIPSFCFLSFLMTSLSSSPPSPFI